MLNYMLVDDLAYIIMNKNKLLELILIIFILPYYLRVP